MVNKSGYILGIALFYTVITTVFSLIIKIAAKITYGFSKNTGLLSLWLVVAIVIIIILYILFKRQKQSPDDGLFKNNLIRETTGLLIMIDAYIKLSSAFPFFISHYIIVRSFNPEMGLKALTSLTQSTLANEAEISMLVLQNIFGNFLLKGYRRLNQGENVKEECEIKSANRIRLGIAIFFVIITGAASLFAKLVPLIVLPSTTSSLLMPYAVWAVVMALIIIILCRTITKQSVNPKTFINNNVIRKTAGVLVIISGIMAASTQTLAVISSISYVSSKSYRLQPDRMVFSTVIANIALLVIVLCQVVFGLYLLKYYKNKAQS